MLFTDIWNTSTLTSIGRLPGPERTNLIMYFINELFEIKHEISQLKSRASSLMAPWSAVRHLLPPSWYKLATPQRSVPIVADELGTQHLTKYSTASWSTLVKMRQALPDRQL